uniref:Kinesin motor domain-containing protein n=1 Tax=Brugia timori TaxID=42155 RepID=A0A0R3RB70_9BILA
LRCDFCISFLLDGSLFNMQAVERNAFDLRCIELMREIVVPNALNETLKRGICVCAFFLFVSQKKRSGFQMTVDIAIT